MEGWSHNARAIILNINTTLSVNAISLESTFQAAMLTDCSRMLLFLPTKVLLNQSQPCVHLQH